MVRRRAGYIKQSILQAAGLRYADLGVIPRRYLDLYARVASKVELYDAHAHEHGFLDAEGKAPPWIKEYYSAINSAARLLSKLDEHLYRERANGPSPLDRHLSEHYTDAEFREVGDG